MQALGCSGGREAGEPGEAARRSPSTRSSRRPTPWPGLNHENVLPLHCSFIAGEDLWLVMPYVAGGNLSELLRSQVTSLTHVLSA